MASQKQQLAEYCCVFRKTSSVLMVMWFCLAAAGFHPCSGCDPNAKPVVMGLYYESLCPFCANFIANKLGLIFDSDLSSIVTLRMVPWGNTIINSDYTLNCQHGAEECTLDAVDACIINNWPDVATHLKIIQCIERFALDGKSEQWRSCFDTMGLDVKPILDCYTSGLAGQLELGYSGETDSLNPPHKFVPWVVVDNQPLLSDYPNFVTHICRAYNGCNKPSACGSTQANADSVETSAISTQPRVTYASRSTSVAAAESQSTRV